MHRKCWAQQQAQLQPPPQSRPTGEDASDPGNVPDPALADKLPEFMDIATAPISTAEYLDAKTLQLAEREYKRCLANVVLFNRQDAWDTDGGSNNDYTKRRASVAWTELYMFPKACRPRMPGGKAKQKRNTAARVTRLERWAAGERATLWLDALRRKP